MVTEFIREVFVETTLQRGYRDGEQAALLAESGVMGGVRLLQKSLADHPDYTSLGDPWHALPLHLEDERGTVDVVIEEESGKLNLNQVAAADGTYANRFPAQLLGRLLKRRSLPAELVEPLADWLDEDDLPNPSGAEAGWYQSQTPPYRPRNGKLKTLEELRLVKGYTEAAFAALRPCITVYADDASDQVAPLNINTAPPELLAALDDTLTDELVRRIVEYRKSTPFRAYLDLGNVAGLKQITDAIPATAIAFKGAVYRLTATARIGESFRTIEAVVRLDGAPLFLYWRER